MTVDIRPNIDLSNRVALVTGGSRGIGRATAIGLARAGADVAITYLNARRNAEEVGEEILALGRRTLIARADLSEAEDVTNLIDSIGDHFGRLDILVSNAAGGGFRPLLEVTSENFDYALRLNVRAFMLLVQSAAPLMERNEQRTGRARVITVSSWGAERALPTYGAIGASKAALESMTRHFALELGGRGVNVNCVRAGIVDTGSIRALRGGGDLEGEAPALTRGRRRSDAGGCREHDPVPGERPREYDPGADDHRRWGDLAAPVDPGPDAWAWAWSWAWTVRVLRDRHGDRDRRRHRGAGGRWAVGGGRWAVGGGR